MAPVDELLQAQLQLARWTVAARRLVIFTGAGISTESGIPDFRGPQGVWTQLDPRQFDFQAYLADPELRRQRWQVYRDGGLGANAQPNAAHFAVAELVQLGLVDCVITQNVDGLHARAGVPEDRLLEIHGSNRFAKCLSCWKRYPREETLRWESDPAAGVPLCPACGGLMKSGGVSFGEPMPPDETREAIRRARAADLFLVIGSSLVVYPAAALPGYAVERGARLVIVNLSPTPLDHLAALVVRAKAGEFLPGVVAAVKQLRGAA
ncbi:MAG: Sir2 family NAD-dependent protein deacetylase [Chloroflexi bacterium]|jgi:NAD-dependent deacetylase|nr:Sir2 family NAD-dependent protein deacetylase [Chloroflexota bacterium]GIW11738.1 MAG: NAD-dependent deacetylase [Dehalococcoidia bacterium]